MNMLEVSGLTTQYKGAVQGVVDVDLHVGAGQVVGLLGANGAGKTTLLRTVSGVLNRHAGRVTAGRVAIEGVDVTRSPAHERVRRGLVQVPEGRRIFTSLTVEENLMVGATTTPSRDRARELARVNELFPVLAERRDQRAGLLSGGEQQMLAIGRALMARPKVLVLDEPSLGLAPRIVAEIGQMIRRINESGTAVLLVEQNTGMALDVVDTAYVLSLGHVIASGSPRELDESGELRAIYLGQHAASTHAASSHGGAA